MFYLIKLYDGEFERAWLHHGTDGASRGCWGRDYDARYADNLFGYASPKSATARWRVERPKHSEHGISIEVVNRKELFDLLGVADWSGGR